MRFTPDQAVAHLKESIASYIESQYRISHPLVFKERAELLLQPGVIAQEPFYRSNACFCSGPVPAGPGAAIPARHPLRPFGVDGTWHTYGPVSSLYSPGRSASVQFWRGPKSAGGQWHGFRQGRFQDAFVPSDPWPGIRELAESLEATVPDETLDPQVAFFRTLADNEDLKWVRARTARNATKLSELAQDAGPTIPVR